MVALSTVKFYDPDAQSIRSLLASCEADWGTPETNRELLLPFGVRPLDLALYGMDVINGELILIQGPEKQRKTTLAANIVAYYMQSDKPKVKPMTVVDSLESGMTPKRYRDTFISIVATQVLLALGHRHKEFCPVCQTPACHMLGISPEFLRYNTRKPAQTEAIVRAMEIMKTWPLQIYGASEKEGDTRSMANSITGTKDRESRWRALIREYGAKVFVADHLQQYSFSGEQLTDYEKQLRAIAASSDVVAQEKCVLLLLSQVSLGSQKEAAQGTGKYNASGGKKAAQEATSIISVNYESGSGLVTITLEDSRKAPTFSVTQPLEDSSGAFYGVPTEGKKSQYRPGMEEGAKNGSNYHKSN